MDFNGFDKGVIGKGKLCRAWDERKEKEKSKDT